MTAILKGIELIGNSDWRSERFQNSEQSCKALMVDTYVSQYQLGRYSDTWTTLIALGARVQDQDIRGDATAVARETMKRVRHNVEIIYQRLQDIGYQFRVPARAFVPPSEDTGAIIDAIERRIGYLPLSLKAFYEEVGAVDFRQSNLQLRQWDHPQRAQADELQVLGEEDPLVVHSLDDLRQEVESVGRRLYFCFAPDEFHKANYGGGENYHVWLPDGQADFRIQGMYGVDEYFVDYLRATLAQGGVRGRIMDDGDGQTHKEPPKLKIASQLATGLLRF